MVQKMTEKKCAWNFSMLARITFSVAQFICHPFSFSRCDREREMFMMINILNSQWNKNINKNKKRNQRLSNASFRIFVRVRAAVYKQKRRATEWQWLRRNKILKTKKKEEKKIETINYDTDTFVCFDANNLRLSNEFFLFGIFLTFFFAVIFLLLLWQSTATPSNTKWLKEKRVIYVNVQCVQIVRLITTLTLLLASEKWRRHCWNGTSQNATVDIVQCLFSSLSLSFLFKLNFWHFCFSYVWLSLLYLSKLIKYFLFFHLSTSWLTFSLIIFRFFFYLQKPLLINYNAGILMTNGMMWNIHKIARYGDTIMILDKNVLRFNGNLQIEKVNVSLPTNNINNVVLLLFSFFMPFFPWNNSAKLMKRLFKSRKSLSLDKFEANTKAVRRQSTFRVAVSVRFISETSEWAKAR